MGRAQLFFIALCGYERKVLTFKLTLYLIFLRSSPWVAVNKQVRSIQCPDVGEQKIYIADYHTSTHHIREKRIKFRWIEQKKIIIFNFMSLSAYHSQRMLWLHQSMNMFVYLISQFEASATKKKNERKEIYWTFFFSLACAVRWVCICFGGTGYMILIRYSYFHRRILYLVWHTYDVSTAQLLLLSSGFSVFVPFLWFLFPFFYLPSQKFIYIYTCVWGWGLSTDEQCDAIYINLSHALNRPRKLLFISIVCWMMFVQSV